MRFAQLLACALLAAVVAAQSAHGAAGPRTIGSVTTPTRVAAHDGWVVWSVAAPAGGFALRVWRNGSARTLSVDRRSAPFDVDLGTDARGRTVATYSRCATGTIGLTPGTSAAAGCQVHVLDLATGTERLVRLPHPAAASDTVPSMWRGKVAFTRRDTGRHRYVPQVLLWSPGSRRLTTLHHGAVPAHCPTYGTKPCPRGRVVADVGAIDLGAKVAAMQWDVSASDSPVWDAPESFSEIRAEQLAGHRSTVLTSVAFDHEVCAQDQSVTPSAPTVAGPVVFYAQLIERCFSFRSQLTWNAVRPFAHMHAPLTGIVGQVAVDGRSAYGLVYPTNPHDEWPACDRPGQPCLIRQLPMPRLSPARTRSR